MNPYLKSQISSTSPLNLIILLYDRMIHHLDLAIDAFEGKTIETRVIAINENLISAQKIIMELNIMLDMEKGGDPAVYLRNLYESSYAILVEVNMNKKDLVPLQKIRKLMSELRDTWKEISHPNSTPHQTSTSSSNLVAA